MSDNLENDLSPRLSHSYYKDLMSQPPQSILTGQSLERELFDSQRQAFSEILERGVVLKQLYDEIAGEEGSVDIDTRVFADNLTVAATNFNVLDSRARAYLGNVADALLRVRSEYPVLRLLMSLEENRAKNAGVEIRVIGGSLGEYVIPTVSLGFGTTLPLGDDEVPIFSRLITQYVHQREPELAREWDDPEYFSSLNRLSILYLYLLAAQMTLTVAHGVMRKEDLADLITLRQIRDDRDIDSLLRHADSTSLERLTNWREALLAHEPRSGEGAPIDLADLFRRVDLVLLWGEDGATEGVFFSLDSGNDQLIIEVLQSYLITPDDNHLLRLEERLRSNLLSQGEREQLERRRDQIEQDMKQAVVDFLTQFRERS